LLDIALTLTDGSRVHLLDVSGVTNWRDLL
jgi:hypothetical protein